MEQRASSQHEAFTLTPIGWCVPNIYANSRMKLGEISKSEIPDLRKFSSARGTRHYSCNGILIEERMNKISTMVRKSVSDFHAQLKQYTTELTERIKRATTKADYGFVRKPELRHQYGMLFNLHGQVISGLKNMDLFLSIDLPKVEDIAHVPPPFPECDNWAAPHKSNRNHHVYYSSLGFGKDNHGPMTELNTNTSEYLAEAIHITVCNQYKNKYIKLLERIETIK